MVFFHWHCFKSAFFPIQCFVLVGVFFHSTLFPIDIFSYLMYCPHRRFSSTFCTSWRFFLFDVTSPSALIILTCCPSTFFTVEVFSSTFLSVNHYTCWWGEGGYIWKCQTIQLLLIADFRHRRKYGWNTSWEFCESHVFLHLQFYNKLNGYVNFNSVSDCIFIKFRKLFSHPIREFR